MSAANFTRCLAIVLEYEGGFVNDPNDDGGATNLGVTIGTLSDYLRHPASVADVEALTKAKVAPIYKGKYWDLVAGDQLPAGLDLAVFDFAVHSSPIRAVRYMQACYGVTADGHVGPKTLAAVNAAILKPFIIDLCARRLDFLQQNHDWRYYKKGWSARIERVKADSLAMVGS